MIVFTAITVGLTQVVKMAELIPNKFIPLISLIIGVGLAIYQDMSAIDGIIIGLSASGLYSSVKNIRS